VIGLRDGVNSGELTKDQITHDNMVRLMVGRNIKPAQRTQQRTKQGDSLKVERLKTKAWPNYELSFEAFSGEILGITGLVGSGRTEIACTLFGVDTAIDGNVYLMNKRIRLNSIADAIQNRIYLVPEDRRNTGLVVDMSVMENLTLPDLERHSHCGIIRRKSEIQAAQTQCSESNIKASTIYMHAKNLSGGNQQKIVLAKWLSLKPKVMLLDEPTRGIDIGSKEEIYKLLRTLSEKGIIVLLISSDMEEVMSVCDRVMVMHEGQISGILTQNECTEEKLMNLAVGKSV
jgi:ribose transport system ATP-binding protein